MRDLDLCRPARAKGENEPSPEPLPVAIVDSLRLCGEALSRLVGDELNLQQVPVFRDPLAVPAEFDGVLVISAHSDAQLQELLTDNAWLQPRCPVVLVRGPDCDRQHPAAASYPGLLVQTQATEVESLIDAIKCLTEHLAATASAG